MSSIKSNHKNFVNLVGLCTCCKMMHGAYNVKFLSISCDVLRFTCTQHSSITTSEMYVGLYTWPVITKSILSSSFRWPQTCPDVSKDTLNISRYISIVLQIVYFYKKFSVFSGIVAFIIICTSVRKLYLHSHINPIHTIQAYFKNHFNIILPFTSLPSEKLFIYVIVRKLGLL